MALSINWDGSSNCIFAEVPLVRRNPWTLQTLRVQSSLHLLTYMKPTRFVKLTIAKISIRTLAVAVPSIGQTRVKPGRRSAIALG